jgi:hypothetical protein
MKLGIYLNSQHRERDDPARRLAGTLEQARMIRALDFDSIRAGEHHLVPGFHYFPRLPLCSGGPPGGRGQSTKRMKRGHRSARHTHEPLCPRLYKDTKRANELAVDLC